MKLSKLNPFRRPDVPVKNPGRELARLGLALFVAYGFTLVYKDVLVLHNPTVWQSAENIGLSAAFTLGIWLLTRDEKPKKPKE